MVGNPLMNRLVDNKLHLNATIGSMCEVSDKHEPGIF